MVAFDVLALGDRVLTSLSYQERRAILEDQDLAHHRVQ